MALSFEGAGSLADADEACRVIERLHGRRKLNDVFFELEMLLDAELEAWTFRAARERPN